ncbi:MAG: hypothetical protein C0462_08690 [Alcanivorax sp.]|nr:hypothetical protein [Alcanivorax sp.]
MTEPGDLQALSRTLAQLAEQGAAEHDPLRFAYLSGLHARLSAMPRAPQRLWQKLGNGLEQYRSALPQRHDRDDATAAETKTSRLSPLLAMLNSDDAAPAPENTLADLLGQQALRFLPDYGSSRDSRRSTFRHLAPLRDAVARRQRQQRIRDLIGQAPPDAGPLNSHRIVARALETLQQQTPTYLDHLVNYLDSLIALEQIREQRGDR